MLRYKKERDEYVVVVVVVVVVVLNFFVAQATLKPDFSQMTDKQAQKQAHNES